MAAAKSAKDKDDYYAAFKPTLGLESPFRKPSLSELTIKNNKFIKIILRNSSEQSDKINEVMKKQKKV